MNMIPYGRQDISQADIDAVVEVLQSDFLTQGPRVPVFEKKLTTYCGVAHGVAVNSATSALHIACLALGVNEGDWVWTSPITFVASANCALYCGARIDFVDIDPDTYNLSIDALAEKLAEAEQEGRLPKVLIPVHMCGQSCDMASVYALSQRYGFKIIEDASHAVGGKYRGEAIGSCRYSDITVFSFHPVKIVTTAEGGIALTNDPYVAERMELYRSHGITRDAEKMTSAPHGAWYYEQVLLGFNYRMTELQAALGISQLDRLDAFVTRRHEIAERYDLLLADLPVRLPVRRPDAYSAFHLYVIRLDPVASLRTHAEVFNTLRKENIGVNLHYIPVHTQPYYRQFGFAEGDFPEAESYYAEAISLPMYSAMSDMQQDEVVRVLRRAVSAREYSDGV